MFSNLETPPAAQSGRRGNALPKDLLAAATTTATTAAATATTAALERIENEGPVGEINLGAGKVVERRGVHGELETVTGHDAVLRLERVGVGHAEAWTAATATGDVNADAEDAGLGLLHDLGEHGGGSRGKMEGVGTDRRGDAGRHKYSCVSQ